MNILFINQISENCEKIINFSCNEPCFIYIDGPEKGIRVLEGKHQIKIKRHHDLFFDWFVDDVLIEDYLVYVLITDEESCLPIKFDKKIEIEENYKIENKNILPIKYKIEDVINFTIICKKQSQISFYFHNNSEPDYKSVTLYFENDYCKVFLDSTVGGKYQPSARQNMSLFKTNINILNFISINTKSKKMIVKNDIIDSKEYDLSELNFDSQIIEICETYKPNGQGIYLIDQVL